MMSLERPQEAVLVYIGDSAGNHSTRSGSKVGIWKRQLISNTDRRPCVQYIHIFRTVMETVPSGSKSPFIPGAYTVFKISQYTRR